MGSSELNSVYQKRNLWIRQHEYKDSLSRVPDSPLKCAEIKENDDVILTHISYTGLGIIN